MKLCFLSPGRRMDIQTGMLNSLRGQLLETCVRTTIHTRHVDSLPHSVKECPIYFLPAFPLLLASDCSGRRYGSIRTVIDIRSLVQRNRARARLGLSSTSNLMSVTLTLSLLLPSSWSNTGQSVCQPPSPYRVLFVVTYGLWGILTYQKLGNAFFCPLLFSRCPRCDSSNVRYS